ncbi:TetR/AcrR family transcriptional regulator [Mesorhizobium sp. B1-1-9]|nr:TetR/AcrR family transcriptional regulator [Mesorhizobium sp. B1-1-7]TPN58525.1 TetR/AcrR family transcriptional regulator [Mesorhizobium sp. B1-1-9]
MTARQRGRPPRDQVGVTPGAMLSTALEILDGEGAEALTMRALAKRSGINPMTIYHHFGDRDGLIRALSERVYAGVAAPQKGSARTRLEELLQSYQSQVVQHPGLTLTIFSRPSVFPDQAKRITDDLRTLLRELGLPPSRSQLWVSILVDFTHGAALATAMSRRSENEDGQKTSIGDKEYASALAELLDSLDRSN